MLITSSSCERDTMSTAFLGQTNEIPRRIMHKEDSDKHMLSFPRASHTRILYLYLYDARVWQEHRERETARKKDVRRVGGFACLSKPVVSLDGTERHPMTRCA